MHEILIQKLHDYLKENNPDLLLELEEQGKVTSYLSDKVSALDNSITDEEACMNLLTEDLRPSKFNYIKGTLEEEFEESYNQFLHSGTLQFEVINMINHSRKVFDAIGFTEENEDSRQLRYAITGTISEYLESQEK